MHGIVHVEIPCQDINRVKKFYGDCFGWETEYIKEMDYGMYKTPAGVNGGFSKDLKPAAKGGGVLLHIEVADIENALAKIGKAGGNTVRPKTAIPGIGHFAIFKDTEGNEIGIFSSQK